MTGTDREVIRLGFQNGQTAAQIADQYQLSKDDVEIYLAWWCDRGCPESGHP